MVVVGAAGLIGQRSHRAPHREDGPAQKVGAPLASPPGATGAGALATAPLRVAGARAEAADVSVPAPPGSVPGMPHRATRPRGGPRLDPATRVHAPSAQAEANLRSVVEAAQTGLHPERLSPLIPPAPFDPEAFVRDPQAYLDIVEPGRVFQSADEEDALTSLEPEGPVHLETVPRGSVRLSVKGEPLSPVTFTSFDRGAFENDLGSITVLTDATGAASVRFIATVGTIDDVNILSASPLTVGQVAFRVTVNPE